MSPAGGFIKGISQADLDRLIEDIKKKAAENLERAKDAEAKEQQENDRLKTLLSQT